MQTFKIEQTDLQCVVTWRFFSFAVVFSLVFLTIWTVGCLVMTGAALAHQQFEVLLFMLPFWAVWLVLLAFIANVLFGKTRLVLDENGLEALWTCLSFRWERRFEITEIRRFETNIHRGRKGGTTYSLRIVLQEGNTKNLTAPAGKEEFDFLCNQLNTFLSVLKTGNAGIPAKWEIPAPRVFEYNSPPQHLEPPPKCRWCYQTDFNGFGFRFRESGKVSVFFFWLFFAVLWNGILTPFLLSLLGILEPTPPLDDNRWWFLFFFLIPFTVVGLVLLGGAIDTFLELFRRTSWRFAYGEAVFRTVRLRTRVMHYDLTNWNALAIRLIRAKQSEESENEDDLESFYEEGNRWQLAFLDKSGADLAVIEKLRKPEALWLADMILRERRTIR